MRLQFCGAAGEVTGSCTKLTVENSLILVDCGLFQGSKFAEDQNFEPFPFNASAVDAVVLTHAHLDHCGRLPKLVNQGFVGKIYATAPTRDLVGLMLLDAAGIMAEEAERHGHPPLYSEEDAVETLDRFHVLPYDQTFQIAQGVSLTLRNAGHVLGSAFVEIAGDSRTIIFSGDVGNYPVPLLRQPEALPPADAMVLESTYGDRTHADWNQGESILAQAIRDTVRDKGVLLIPAFSLERTQELLTVIDRLLADHQVPTISAYLDGPLGIRVSRVYEKYHDLFNPATQARERREGDHDVLTFPSLTVTETPEQSKMINSVTPPKMIIAGSGMMHGGRILHHLKRYLPFENTRLVVVGHQVQGTLGRQLLEGARVVTIHGERVEANARVIGTHAFSSHMDHNQLVAWIGAMAKPPREIFLNHGDDEARAALRSAIVEKFGVKAYIPRLGQGYLVGASDATGDA